MALKVLLVDPDEKWLMAAKTFLEQELYDVKVVATGKEAQSALYGNEGEKKYFAVIINYNTKNHSAIQVVKYVKSNFTNLNIFLIADSEGQLEEDGLNREKLQKMGITETIFKPFEIKELKNYLEGHQSVSELVSTLKVKEGVSSEVEVDMQDSDFTAIKIGEFYSSKAVIFDVFVKLRSNRYVKILHAGDTFSKERIDKYKDEKKVTHLYFHKKDRKKYIKFNNFMVSKLLESGSIGGTTKVNLLKNVTSKFVEEAFTDGMKPQIIEQGKEICENVYKLIEKQDDLHKILKSYQDFDPNAFDHAFLVTLFSTSIIKQFEWQSKITIETTALACMFHDIGKMTLPKELLEKKAKEMTPKEYELYQTHPEVGCELLKNNSTINQSVKQIILQHHEAYDGTGWPRGLKGSKILTLANVIKLADDFAHLMVDQNLKPVEALRCILTNRAEISSYNSVIIENFIKVFANPDKVTKESSLPSNSSVVANKKVS